MAKNERIEQAIEDHLVSKLDADLTQEEITLLESKVSTVRKLSETE